MFNHSDVESGGRERLMEMQREARQHDLARRARDHGQPSEVDHRHPIQILRALAQRVSARMTHSQQQKRPARLYGRHVTQ